MYDLDFLYKIHATTINTGKVLNIMIAFKSLRITRQICFYSIKK